MTLNELQTPPTEIEVTEVLNALRFLLSRQKSGREYLSSAVDVVRRLVFQRTALQAEVARLLVDNQALLDAAEVQGEIVLKMAAEVAKGE